MSSAACLAPGGDHLGNSLDVPDPLVMLAPLGIGPDQVEVNLQTPEIE